MARVAVPRSRFKQTLVTLFKIGLGGFVVAVIALVVAVAVAMNQLPNYQELVGRNNLGQMIRVRAADGSVLVAMGPSFGNWLPYDRIPEVMKTAIVDVEDRRFRSHIGVDPI